MLTRPATASAMMTSRLEKRSTFRRSLSSADRHARLRQAGMQIDRMRHHGRADDADREQQRPGVGDLRRDRVRARPRAQSTGAMNISIR